MHLPSTPIIPHKRSYHSAWASLLALPPNGNCLHLLWAVHLSSDDDHAKHVLAMALLNPNWAGANPPSAPLRHHPNALPVEEVVIPAVEAPPRPLNVLCAMLLEVLMVPLCRCQVNFFGSP